MKLTERDRVSLFHPRRQDYTNQEKRDVLAHSVDSSQGRPDFLCLYFAPGARGKAKVERRGGGVCRPLRPCFCRAVVSGSGLARPWNPGYLVSKAQQATG